VRQRWREDIICGLVRRLMTAADRNELLTALTALTAQEKLEWVTPKISLMEAGDTEGKFYVISENLKAPFGPS